MWQRFTERARKTVFYGQEEAQKLGHGYVSTEHLLLGLLRESDNLAARVLEMLGIDIEDFAERVREMSNKSERKSSEHMTLTPMAKMVIDYAYDEARNLNNNYIGTEHLLLGLVRGEGLASKILAGEGIVIESARKTVMDLQSKEDRIAEQPKGPFESLKERILGKQQPSLEALPVSYDLQNLHPVDLLLLSLLSDKSTSLGERLRQKCQSLDWVLPAIVATMTQWNDNDANLATVLAAATKVASESGRSEVELEDLYQAAYDQTTDQVKAALSGMDLTPRTER